MVDHAGLEPPNSRRPGDYRVQHVDGIMAHHQVWGAKVNLQARVGTFALLQALGGGPGHIPVGTAHKNRKVNLLVAGPDVRIITDDGELLRALTIDPTRNYQPLGGRWPVHNVLQQACTMS